MGMDAGGNDLEDECGVKCVCPKVKQNLPGL